jgi:hypothetical protein
MRACYVSLSDVQGLIVHSKSKPNDDLASQRAVNVRSCSREQDKLSRRYLRA